MKSTTFTELVTYFIKQQAEKAVASETKFRKSMSLEITVKETYEHRRIDR